MTFTRLLPGVKQLHHPSGVMFDSFRRFTEAHPETSWFQTEAFFRFAQQWPEAEPVLLIALKEQKLKDPGAGFWKQQRMAVDPPMSRQDEKLVAGSLLAITISEPPPRHKLLMPFNRLRKRLTARTVVYGGPLLAEGTRLEKETTLKALLQALQEKVSGRSLFTQLRNFYDMADYKPLMHSLGYKWHDRLNLLVNTSSHDTAWMGMSNTRRRQVKKSLANGAQIIENPSPQQVDAFYDILHALYKKKVRKPLPSRDFFHALTGMTAAPGPQTPGSTPKGPDKHDEAPACDPRPAITLLITHDSQVIGGITCPILPGKAMYEWYVCGLDREYKDKKIFPSVLATWAALEHAARNNVPRFDFMGLGTPEEKYGVRDFKARFGGTWVNHGRFSRINKKGSYAIVEIAYNIYQYIKR